MPLKYSVIEIFTGEEAHCRNKPLHEAVADYVRSLKLAARCTVFRGSEGCYENGEVVTQKILNLSFNMPLKIEILLPALELDRIRRVAVIDEDGRFLGMIADKDLLAAFSEHRTGILSYFAEKIKNATTHGESLHRTLREKTAREVMTSGLMTVREDAPIDEAIGLLSERAIKRIPVLDAEGRYKGMISRESLLQVGFLGP